MDKFLCVLGIYDQETQRVLKEYQDAILQAGFTGQQTMDIPFHVTLGTFPLDRQGELESKLNGLKMEQFEVYFNHMGLFEGQRVLFIAPDVSGEFLALKETFSDDKGWTAHTTMLIDERENTLKAMEILGERFRRFSGRIERAELWEFFPARKLGVKSLK